MQEDQELKPKARMAGQKTSWRNAIIKEIIQEVKTRTGKKERKTDYKSIAYAVKDKNHKDQDLIRAKTRKGHKK